MNSQNINSDLQNNINNVQEPLMIEENIPIQSNLNIKSQLYNYPPNNSSNIMPPQTNNYPSNNSSNIIPPQTNNYPPNNIPNLMPSEINNYSINEPFINYQPNSYENNNIMTNQGINQYPHYNAPINNNNLANEPSSDKRLCSFLCGLCSGCACVVVSMVLLLFLMIATYQE